LIGRASTCRAPVEPSLRTGWRRESRRAERNIPGVGASVIRGRPDPERSPARRAGPIPKRGSYPQVMPRAADLMTRAIVIVSAGLAVSDAARLAARRRVACLLVRRGRGVWGVTPGTLEHALALGLARIPVRALLWELAAVSSSAPEVVVRRHLRPDRVGVVVVAGDQPVGIVLRPSDLPRPLPVSLAAQLAALDDATARVLRAASAVGTEQGCSVALVGGFVRDLLLGRAPSRVDLDVAVEGDGPAFARMLAERLGAEVRRYPAFLTARLALPDGRRVDVAATRREWYGRPGALPDVAPATLFEDLGRRDFSVNALAVRLDGERFGEVLDRHGGLRDLRARTIRVLHPLSFIEDPTRIFRAARLAARLGFRLDATTARLLAEAAALPVHADLSGERIRAELHAVFAEPAAAAILARLGRAGAFRLVLADYRFPADAAERLRVVARSLTRLPLAALTRDALFALALTAHLEDEGRRRFGGRLRLPPALSTAMARARTEAPGAGAALTRVRTGGEAYDVLRRVPEAVAAWAHVTSRRPGVRRWIERHLGEWRHLVPLLSGDDLRALGVPPGTRLGHLLAGLRREQVGGQVRTRAAAERWVSRAIAATPAGESADAENTGNLVRKGG
jgi:tRNA nucleotidyltransferase (CCA-adding enzyme)